MGIRCYQVLAILYYLDHMLHRDVDWQKSLLVTESPVYLKRPAKREMFHVTNSRRMIEEFLVISCLYNVGTQTAIFLFVYYLPCHSSRPGSGSDRQVALPPSHPA